MTKLLLGLIRLYQKTLSPDHGWFRGAHPGGYCRFQPTCSQYAEQAVVRYGAWRGGALALKRIARCHPYGATGFDPVPTITSPRA